MISRSHNSLYEQERLWFFAALSCVLVSVACYMYFLSASVHHVVMRKEVDREIGEAITRMSTLETEYIEAQHALSEEIASLRGFKRTDEKIFIDRSDTTLVLRED